MLKLRLTRLGDKKRPSYRIVAMEALSKRDGGAIAYLGNYFPLEDSKVVLKEEEILNFLKNGIDRKKFFYQYHLKIFFIILFVPHFYKIVCLEFSRLHHIK